jgi:hypothetical protein
MTRHPPQVLFKFKNGLKVDNYLNFPISLKYYIDV